MPATVDRMMREGEVWVEEYVSVVQEASNAAEGEAMTLAVEEVHAEKSDSSSSSPRASVISKPFFHENAMCVNPRQRVRIARSLVKFFGFYPHYRFIAFMREDDGLRSNKVTKSTDDTTEEKKRAEAVRNATRAMRASLVQARIRLRGRIVVLDWEPKDINEGSRDANKATAETKLNTNAKNAEGADAALD